MRAVEPSGVLDASGRSVPKHTVQRVRMSARASSRGEGFDFAGAYEGGGDKGPMMADWLALTRSADREIIPNRGPITARTRDLVRNDPIASAGVARRQNASVGRGWRLAARPNFRALGISFEASRQLGAQIEAEWKAHTNGHAFECDAERRFNLGQLLRIAVAHFVMDGECLALIEYADDEPTRYGTRLRIVDPDRLSNPRSKPDKGMMRGGVERNATGIPVRYWIREQHPADLGVSAGRHQWNAWERFTEFGRPQVLHCVDPQRAEQTRGVSRFASALKSFRSLGKFTDATLQAATINALMVAFIKSSAGPEAVSEYLTVDDMKGFEGSREDFYDENPVSLSGGARMPILPFGDEIEMQSGSKDVTSFDGFTRSIIRMIATSLGVTYEELSMDYSQTNYSSARAAMVHAWAETQSLTAVIEAQLMRPFYVAFLEEAFDEGYITLPAGAPDFYDAIDAYADCRWIGPGRGYVDPTKEIDAASARVELGISSKTREAADQGEDLEEIQEELAREQARERELGILPSPDRSTPSPADQAAADQQADARPSALARVARTSRSAEHEAALNQRHV